jgi:hypothetical protein
MKIRFLAIGMIAPLIVVVSSMAGNAVPLPPYNAAFHSGPRQAEPVALRHRSTTVARGPRGGAVVHHQRTVVRPAARPVHPIARPGVRPGVRPVHPIARPGHPWVRPARYYWRPGGAIAAGAAIGFIAATSVGAYAGVPPGPGYCWYYTDPSQTQGFWDVCP